MAVFSCVSFPSRWIRLKSHSRISLNYDKVCESPFSRYSLKTNIVECIIQNLIGRKDWFIHRGICLYTATRI